MLKRFKFAYLHTPTVLLLLLKWTVAPGITYTTALVPSILAIVIPVVFILILFSVMVYYKYKHGLHIEVRHVAIEERDDIGQYEYRATVDIYYRKYHKD